MRSSPDESRAPDRFPGMAVERADNRIFIGHRSTSGTQKPSCSLVIMKDVRGGVVALSRDLKLLP